MIKRLSRCIREYRTAAILTPLFVMGEVIVEVLIPLLLADMQDCYIYRTSETGLILGKLFNLLGLDGLSPAADLWITGAMLVGLCLLSVLLGALSGRFCAVAGSGFAKNVRKDMYDAVQNYSFANIDKFSTASIVTRITTDTARVQEAFQVIIRIAVRCPFMLIVSLSTAFRINRKLSLVFLLAVPVLGFGLIGIATVVHPIFEKVFKTYDELNRVVEENLRGIRVVKTFIRGEFEKLKFGRISESIYKDFVKAEKLLAFNSPLMQFSMYFCMLFISWFGARIIVTSGQTGLSTGQFSTLLSYSIQILISLMMISIVFVTMIISRASAERIVEVLDEKSDIVNPEEPVTEVTDGSIEFRNVSFSYARKADKPVLDRIDLKIASGMTVGILGGTGSSKSSLVQLIPRLYNASEGAVLVGGVDVRGYDIAVLRDAVAMVLQKNVLFSGSIKENLRWGNENATDEEIREACRMAMADSFIEEFPEGYDTHLEQGGSNVSGGQKQRLCIARALLKKPKILIMDDSTSAVDTHTDAMIREEMKKAIPGTTKIIIAQRVSSVESADLIIVMEDGRIDGMGTHEELLSGNEIYREIYEMQTRKGAADNE